MTEPIKRTVSEAFGPDATSETESAQKRIKSLLDQHLPDPADPVAPASSDDQPSPEHTRMSEDTIDMNTEENKDTEPSDLPCFRVCTQEASHLREQFLIMSKIPGCDYGYLEVTPDGLIMLAQTTALRGAHFHTFLSKEWLGECTVKEGSTPFLFQKADLQQLTTATSTKSQQLVLQCEPDEHGEVELHVISQMTEESEVKARVAYSQPQLPPSESYTLDDYFIKLDHQFPDALELPRDTLHAFFKALKVTTDTDSKIEFRITQRILILRVWTRG